MRHNDLRLVAFDLDGTLTPSKKPIPGAMADLLIQLLDRWDVCVISGAQASQLHDQVLTPLGPEGLRRAERLHLMPTCGTRYERIVDGKLTTVYARELSRGRRAAACAALEEEARRLGLWEERTWGPILEDRGSQITFSALGQQAPGEVKENWDPDGSRRARLREAVAPRVPELDVRAGGSTSIDVTARGITKGFGITALRQHTGIGFEEMLFLGDQLGPGGNDQPVLDLGVPCVAVRDWQETAQFVRRLLAGVLPRILQRADGGAGTA